MHNAITIWMTNNGDTPSMYCLFMFITQKWCRKKNRRIVLCLHTRIGVPFCLLLRDPMLYRLTDTHTQHTLIFFPAHRLINQLKGHHHQMYNNCVNWNDFVNIIKIRWMFAMPSMEEWHSTSIRFETISFCVVCNFREYGDGFWTRLRFFFFGDSR